MAYYFTLPATFDPLEFLRSPRLLTHADDARWLISTIVRKLANRDTDPWGCVRLHTDILRRVMYSPTQPAIVEALEAGGAIETSGYYAGIKATGYRLAKRYLGDRCVRVTAIDPRLIARLDSERDRQRDDEQAGRWQPVHHALAAEQRCLTITRDADEILDGLPQPCRLCQDVLVSNIRRRECRLSVSSTGRVFNLITGLKREVRTALRIDGQPPGSVDIRCAQPALLAMLLAIEIPTNKLNELSTYKHAVWPLPVRLPPSLPLPSGPSASADFSAFASLAGAGALYERLMELTGLDRATIKQRFLVDVLAKRGR